MKAEELSFDAWSNAWLERQGQVKESSILQQENKTCCKNGNSLTCEDERIKKEILDLVSISGNGNQFEEIKDWLEEQGQQNLASSAKTCKNDSLLDLL